MRRFPNGRQSAELQLGIGAVLTSIAFSIIHLLFDPLPNPDGVVYLLAAQAWLDDGYAAAATVFPLTFYPILIASWHAMTGLEWLTSAHCVDALLIAASIVALQRLCSALGGDIRVQLIVTVLALLLPELNGFRSFLLRDFGYWLFATLALTALVRYSAAPTLRRSGTFVAMCGLAAAFRLEAAPFMLVMPLALLIVPRRACAAATLYIPASIAVAGATVAIVLLPETPIGTWLRAGLQSGLRLADEIPERIHAQVAGFGSQVLDPGFHDYAGFGVAGGLATMIVVHIVNAASLPLATVAAIGVARRTLGRFDRDAAPLVYAALGVTVAGLAAILMARGIIQTRYAMPAGLLIVVVASFVLDDWYARAGERRGRLRWVAVLLVGYLVGEAGFGLLNSKQQYVEAADWLTHNTRSDARIYSNDLRVVYLADRPVDWRRLSGVVPPASGEYDYWVLNAARGHANADDVAGERGLTRVAQFANRKGHALAIYRTSPTTESGLAR